MGQKFADIASTGPLMLAALVAALAGLVSFLSPCILPLVPGYLSYVTGLAGADMDSGSRRTRMLAGSGLFVAGFTVIFVGTGIVFAGLGRVLGEHQRTVEIVTGALIMLMGLSFAGLVPGLQRELRIRKLPAVGLAGAPLLGAVFALGWVPCVGPTLGAVLGLAAVEGSVGRGALLSVAYCIGLGLPFLVFSLGLRKVMGLFTAVRKHSRWVTRIGGALLVIVGLALVSGLWGEFMNWLRATVGPGTVGI
ncbi:cytochrome c biogenesis CcdA family protein [Longispora albida]|uniref:cytochrome c biogenesis CcdA family protein n=1 Tax=Longispora albida TaxID=203523 RepID=UPI000369BE63|nr:cytochrome c biogenesis protein CcdA [Longispora albida]